MRTNPQEYIERITKELPKSLHQMHIDEDTFKLVKPINLAFRNLYRLEDCKPRVVEQTQTLIREYLDDVFGSQAINYFVLGFAQEIELVHFLQHFVDEQNENGSHVECYSDKYTHTKWLIYVKPVDGEEEFYYVDSYKDNLGEVLRTCRSTGNIGKDRYFLHFNRLAREDDKKCL